MVGARIGSAQDFVAENEANVYAGLPGNLQGSVQLLTQAVQERHAQRAAPGGV
jgi:hypothetical protein